MSIRLSAVICTYNRYHYLERAISSLLNQTLSPDEFEIIIVDNSPDQDAARKFGAFYAGIAHLRYQVIGTPGLSNARNVGIGLANGGLVGFIDDDIIAEPRWAAALLQGLADFGPEAGAVGGPVKPIWLSPPPPWLPEPLLHMIAIDDHGPPLRALPPTHNIVGCNMALDKALIERLGGFAVNLGRIGPEITLLSNEDPDMFGKIRAAGRAVVHVPDAVVRHHIDPSRLTQSWFRRRVAWQAVSDFLMSPQAMAAQAGPAGTYLREITAKAERPLPVGLFDHAETADAFAAELSLFRQLVIATLYGGAEP